jgi:ADP-ribose pyrophosphatase YjhB (NUDIX family)
MSPPPWLEWARALQAISQNGLHFSRDPYDRERFARVAEIAAEILACHTNLSNAEIIDLNASEFGYATPKVDVRGAAFERDRILLVREVADQGRWTLPGGWADINDTPAQAIEREIREESGFEAKAIKLLAVYDRETQGNQPPYPYHIYKLFFLCRIIGGAARTSPETSGVAFFEEHEIPELSVSRVNEKQLRRCFEHHRHRHWPTDFD